MTEFKDLQQAAAQMYESNESRKWLFSHTYSQEEYLQVRRALKVLSQFKSVEWKGRTGERVPVEAEV